MPVTSRGCDDVTGGGDEGGFGAHVGDDEVLFDVHQLLHARRPEGEEPRQATPPHHRPRPLPATPQSTPTTPKTGHAPSSQTTPPLHSPRPLKANTFIPHHKPRPLPVGHAPHPYNSQWPLREPRPLIGHAPSSQATPLPAFTVKPAYRPRPLLIGHAPFQLSPNDLRPPIGHTPSQTTPPTCAPNKPRPPIGHAPISRSPASQHWPRPHLHKATPPPPGHASS